MYAFPSLCKQDLAANYTGTDVTACADISCNKADSTCALHRRLDGLCACKLFQMKARRNALTPFGRLPAKLLLIIVGWVVETPQQITKAWLMYVMTAG
jgi:hypothetical protein